MQGGKIEKKSKSHDQINHGSSSESGRKGERRAIARVLNPQPGQVYLEVGCYDGEFALWLEKRYKVKVIGVDINEERLRASSLETIVLADAENLPIPSGSVDGVICRHTIEHVLNPDRALSEMQRVTKDNGLIILTYPGELWQGFQALHSAYAANGRRFNMRKIVETARALHRNKFMLPIDNTSFDNRLRAESSLTWRIWAPRPVWVTVQRKYQVGMTPDAVGRKLPELHLIGQAAPTGPPPEFDKVYHGGLSHTCINALAGLGWGLINGIINETGILALGYMYVMSAGAFSLYGAGVAENDRGQSFFTRARQEEAERTSELLGRTETPIFRASGSALKKGLNHLMWGLAKTPVEMGAGYLIGSLGGEAIRKIFT